MTDDFYRRESPTQTSKDAIAQKKSGEIWGRTPKNGMCPTVQAYGGSLKDGRRGINFSTSVKPNPSGSPFEARWYLELTPGVLLRQKDGEDFACIPATIANFQP